MHRDLKPENILIANENPLSIRITDFGLASLKSTTRTFCGSPMYYAPEISYRHEDYTSAVDIWSLGVILLEAGYGLPSRDHVCRRVHLHILYHATLFYHKRIGELVAKTMLAEHPNTRYTAKDCLTIFREGLRNSPQYEAVAMAPDHGFTGKPAVSNHSVNKVNDVAGKVEGEAQCQYQDQDQDDVQDDSDSTINGLDCVLQNRANRLEDDQPGRKRKRSETFDRVSYTSDCHLHGTLSDVNLDMVHKILSEVYRRGPEQHSSEACPIEDHFEKLTTHLSRLRVNAIGIEYMEHGLKIFGKDGNDEDVFAYLIPKPPVAAISSDSYHSSSSDDDGSENSSDADFSSSFTRYIEMVYRSRRSH